MLALLWVVLLLGIRHGTAQPTPSSVRDMKDQMYKQMAFSRACYKLLNTTGAIGCEEPSGSVVDAAILALKNLHRPLTDDRVVLVMEEQLGALLQEYEEGTDLQTHLRGVLVDPTGTPAAFSPVPPFPNAALAPYPERSYPWNPQGSGISRHYYPFPIYILTPALAADAQKRAHYNHKQAFQGSTHVARMSLKMMAATSSLHCIASSTCNPLGGYSVLSTMPPLPPPASKPPPLELPLTLVSAQVDSDGLFHDIVQGAEAPLSGLMALLAAMDVLHSLNASSSYVRRLVFSALVGEPWGLMGSRRLLWELHSGGASVAGLDGRRIEQVLEVGHVGRGGAAGPFRFYAHTQRGAAFGNASELVQRLSDAAAGAAGVQATVEPASPSNPGIPPSSLMAFLGANASIAGVVLADFDAAFSTPFFHSHRDNASTIHQPSVVAAAVLLARTLHGIGVGNDTTAQGTFKANVTAVEALVRQLSTCLLTRAPGFACPLVLAMMVPGYRLEGEVVNYEVQRYVGVLPFIDTSDPLNPSYKADISRFVWNFMAWKSAQGAVGAPCDPIKNVCPAGQVCVGWKQGTRAAGAGVCLRSSTRYVPAYSARLQCEHCNDSNFRYTVTNTSVDWERQNGWPADPVWAESMWPSGVPNLKLLLKEDRRTEVNVLVAGLVLTVTTLVGCWLAKAAAAKHFKEM